MTSANVLPDAGFAEEAIFKLSNQGIRDGSLVDFGRALAVLSLYTDTTPEEILSICEEGFDEHQYYEGNGIKPPIGQMGRVEAGDIIRHWLAYWSLLAVLCDEGSAAPTGLPWMKMCMLKPCIRDNLVQLPEPFRT